jgi:hypothetical protein
MTVKMFREKQNVPLWERRWGRRKRKVVRSVTDAPVMGETALGVHGGADVGSDRGESRPIGQVSHGREEKKKR